MTFGQMRLIEHRAVVLLVLCCSSDYHPWCEQNRKTDPSPIRALSVPLGNAFLTRERRAGDATAETLNLCNKRLTARMLFHFESGVLNQDLSTGTHDNSKERKQNLEPSAIRA